jgi:transaldolase
MLLLDSAIADEARRAASLGYVQGATTNPTLIARSGQPAPRVVEALLDVLPGPVFYQPVADAVAEICAEGRRIVALAPERVVLKLPCTAAGLAAGAALRAEVTVGVTAVFTPAQALVAAAAGARYLLPYFNRLTRMVGDGTAVLRQMVAVARAVEFVVASIKSPDEAVAAALAGAQHLTLPLAVLEALVVSPLTDLAMDEFRRAGRPAS